MVGVLLLPWGWWGSERLTPFHTSLRLTGSLRLGPHRLDAARLFRTRHSFILPDHSPIHHRSSVDESCNDAGIEAREVASWRVSRVSHVLERQRSSRQRQSRWRRRQRRGWPRGWSWRSRRRRRRRWRCAVRLRSGHPPRSGHGASNPRRHQRRARVGALFAGGLPSRSLLGVCGGVLHDGELGEFSH